MVLRKGFFTVQAIACKSDSITKDCLKYLAGIPNESIVDLYGIIKKTPEPTQCTQSEIEISLEKLFVVTRAVSKLPIQLEDAMRKIDNPDDENEMVEKKEEEKKEEGKEETIKLATVPLHTRLDNRILDLRTPCNQAIFRIQAAVCFLFRESMMSQDFMEIHTPKLIAGSSEGGSSVFNFQYFNTPACLAQSPQLYKQMCIMSDFGRVYELGPVFRAENSFTPRHLCEFTGLDFEMEIKESYLEVLDVIENLFAHMFESLESNYSKLLSVVNEQYPFEAFKFKRPMLKLTFAEGCALLKEHGIEQSVNEDLDTVNEKTLGRLVREKYDTDFYV